MRILEINTEKTWRGGERQTYYALKGFRELGHTVHLVARKGYPLSKIALENYINCFTVDSHLAVIPFLLKKRKKFDVIHVQTASLLTFAVLTQPYHKAKVVYTRRLDFVPSGPLTKWKYNQADMIVAISTPIKNILEKFGVKKTVLIPECIEKREIDKERALSFLKELKVHGKKIIGTTSALVQHKDPLTLVKAIKLLSEKRSDFVMLHFGEGVLRPDIEKEIKHLNLHDHYKLCGFTENVEDFFSVFDVFVMSSEEEGLGSSVLDAFIYKVPVVSTNAGGLAEIVDKRGMLVNKKDPVALSDALHSVLTNPQILAKEIDYAYSYATNELNIKSVHQKYVEVFCKLY